MDSMPLGYPGGVYWNMRAQDQSALVSMRDQYFTTKRVHLLVDCCKIIPGL